MRVAFVHPDLGLGGAERLIIDAALSLQSLSHSTVIYTPFRSPERCFEEVRPRNPRVPVKVVNPIFPRAIFGRLHAILAAVRCTLVALYVCIFCRFDVAVVDIVSLPVLVFALFRKPVLFYCHYPDKILAQTLRPGVPQSGIKLLYRKCVDLLEEISLRYATSICCNSRFTARAFMNTFPRLRQPAVLYPCVRVPDHVKRHPKLTLLSINRYERKKSVSLAIETLFVLHDRCPELTSEVRLVVAGGYDVRVSENVEHLDELKRLVHVRGLDDHVKFLKNISEEERRDLLSEAIALLYTPSNEHFGIVPIEAMAYNVPVIAVNSGGPTESVVDNETGFLCESSARAFSDAVMCLLKEPGKGIRMGHAGRKRVERVFARSVLGRELQDVLTRITNT